jgi:hypothetical protein
MENNNLIDEQLWDVDFYEEVKAKNETYTLWTIVLMFISTILYQISVLDSNRSFLGSFIDYLPYIIFTPFLSIILGILFAFLPYKDLLFRQKYQRAFILTLLFFTIAFFFLLSFIDLFVLYHYLIN